MKRASRDEWCIVTTAKGSTEVQCVTMYRHDHLFGASTWAPSGRTTVRVELRCASEGAAHAALPGVIAALVKRLTATRDTWQAEVDRVNDGLSKANIELVKALESARKAGVTL